MLGALENGRQPHNVDAQILEVVDARDDALEVTDTSPGRILEGRRVDLVDGALLPPAAQLLGLGPHGDDGF